MKERESALTWPIFLFLGIVLVALVLGLIRKDGKDPVIEETIPIIVNAETCESAGGAWEDCEDPCESGEDCLLFCVPRCLCRSQQECPFGYTCEFSQEENGICTNMPSPSPF